LRFLTKLQRKQNFDFQNFRKIVEILKTRFQSQFSCVHKPRSWKPFSATI